MKRYWLACFAVGVMTLFNSCARNPVTGKRDFVLLTEEQEIAMGRDYDPQVIQQFGLYDDPALQRFISEKGEKMVAISHRTNLDYTFRIVDSPVINAFAVPGGYVYFTRGIMAYFNNEAEFAGVLGHEIGHIAARHSAQSYSKSMLAQVGLVMGMVVSPEFAQFANAAQQGVGLLFLKFGREDERESDRLGVEYATKIGYDAQEMAEFFLTLQRTQAESSADPVPSFLSTHPSPEDRLVRVTALAEEWKEKLGLVAPEVGRNSYLRMIDGMIFGNDPRQGFVENNTFYHPVLEFQFPIPIGWSFQNTPQAVQMAPRDGGAMMTFTLVPAETLQGAAQQVVEKYQLQPTETRNVTVNGLPAVAIVAQKQQEQMVIQTLIYLIEYKGNYYNMMGITSAKAFNNYYRQFVDVMTSFKPLTDPGLLNRQPERIQVEPVRQTGTLAQALRAYNVQPDRFEELAIINGMNLEDRVEQGMLIKLISD